MVVGPFEVPDLSSLSKKEREEKIKNELNLEAKEHIIFGLGGTSPSCAECGKGYEREEYTVRRRKAKGTYRVRHTFLRSNLEMDHIVPVNNTAHPWRLCKLDFKKFSMAVWQERMDGFIAEANGAHGPVRLLCKDCHTAV